MSVLVSDGARPAAALHPNHSTPGRQNRMSMICERLMDRVLATRTMSRNHAAKYLELELAHILALRTWLLLSQEDDTGKSTASLHC